MLVQVVYGEASQVEWCADIAKVDVRNDCASDDECLKNGRTICDKDPNCYGIAWYKHRLAEPMQICRSTKMAPKTDGWRTMMKKGFSCIIGILKFSGLILIDT